MKLKLIIAFATAAFILGVPGATAQTCDVDPTVAPPEWGLCEPEDTHCVAWMDNPTAYAEVDCNGTVNHHRTYVLWP